MSSAECIPITGVDETAQGSTAPDLVELLNGDVAGLEPPQTVGLPDGLDAEGTVSDRVPNRSDIQITVLYDHEPVPPDAHEHLRKLFEFKDDKKDLQSPDGLMGLLVGLSDGILQDYFCTVDRELLIGSVGSAVLDGLPSAENPLAGPVGSWLGRRTADYTDEDVARQQTRATEILSAQQVGDPESMAAAPGCNTLDSLRGYCIGRQISGEGVPSRGTERKDHDPVVSWLKVHDIAKGLREKNAEGKLQGINIHGLIVSSVEWYGIPRSIQGQVTDALMTDLGLESRVDNEVPAAVASVGHVSIGRTGAEVEPVEEVATVSSLDHKPALSEPEREQRAEELLQEMSDLVRELSEEDHVNLHWAAIKALEAESPVSSDETTDQRRVRERATQDAQAERRKLRDEHLDILDQYIVLMRERSTLLSEG